MIWDKEAKGSYLFMLHIQRKLCKHQIRESRYLLITWNSESRRKE